jgi:hypothetical protein
MIVGVPDRGEHRQAAENPRKDKSILERSMSPSQIETAQRLAEKFEQSGH